MIFMRANLMAFEAAALVDFGRQPFIQKIMTSVPQTAQSEVTARSTRSISDRHVTHPPAAPLADIIRNGICKEIGDPHDRREWRLQISKQGPGEFVFKNLAGQSITHTEYLNLQETAKSKNWEDRSPSSLTGYYIPADSTDALLQDKELQRMADSAKQLVAPEINPDEYPSNRPGNPNKPHKD